MADTYINNLEMELVQYANDLNKKSLTLTTGRNYTNWLTGKSATLKDVYYSDHFQMEIVEYTNQKGRTFLKPSYVFKDTYIKDNAKTI